MNKQKGYWLNEEKVRWKNFEGICQIRAKTYCYLIDDGSQDD